MIEKFKGEKYLELKEDCLYFRFAEKLWAPL